MKRVARASFLACLALGCSGSGKGITSDADADVNVDSGLAENAAAQMAPPLDGSGEAAAEGPVDAATDATDGAADLQPCSFGGAVPIYCSEGLVYEPSPVIPCIGGGHVYGNCSNGCAAASVMGPVPDPLAALCAGSDAAADGPDGD
jgi:hypothetical protein